MDRAGRLAAALLIAFAASGGAFAAGAFDEGERLFRENRPKEAAAALERAAAEPGADERALLYLGLAYQQLGRLDDAAQAFRRGAAASTRFKALFLFDLGNIHLLQGRNSFAIEIFGQALEIDPGLAPAFLNRANARLSVKDYGGARDDYSAYLELEPGNAQRASIEELLRRLASGIEETRRLEAEAEARRIAAEEARKALLDQVSASLKASADETQSLSSGSGAVQGYGDELNLDE